MALLVLDTNTTALYFDQLVQLEGVEYLFTFQWSDRESAWYINIADQDGNQIASLIRLIVAWPLLRRFQDPRLPLGLLICADMTQQNTDIAASTDLGSRVLLVYVTSDDPLIAGVNLAAPV